MTLRLALLASGGGSNMQAVVDACRSGSVDATPALVLSNFAECGAMLRARDGAIPTAHLSSKTHPDPRALDSAIASVLVEHAIDLVVLAGYLRLVGPETIKQYRDRIVNVHPALLPKYGGEGFYGAHVHRAVLDSGDQESGATVHLVDAMFDHGRILDQVRVPVLPGDTVDTLAIRVHGAETTLLPRTVGRIASGDLVIR